MKNQVLKGVIITVVATVIGAAIIGTAAAIVDLKESVAVNKKTVEMHIVKQTELHVRIDNKLDDLHNGQKEIYHILINKGK